MSFTSKNFREIAISAAQLADQKKAEDILLLDLRKAQSGVSDYMLVISANSQVHLNALRDYIEDSLGEVGVQPSHKEGRKENAWHVLDYGGLLVHIFHEGVRNNYSIERLWEQAKPIIWEKDGGGKTNGHAHAKAHTKKSRPLARRRR